MVCGKSSFREAGEGVETVWFGGGEIKRGMMLSSMTRSGMAWERKLKLIRGEQGDSTSSICKLDSKELVLGCSSWSWWEKRGGQGGLRSGWVQYTHAQTWAAQSSA